MLEWNLAPVARMLEHRAARLKPLGDCPVFAAGVAHERKSVLAVREEERGVSVLVRGAAGFPAGGRALCFREQICATLRCPFAAHGAATVFGRARSERRARPRTRLTDWGRRMSKSYRPHVRRTRARWPLALRLPFCDAAATHKPERFCPQIPDPAARTTDIRRRSTGAEACASCITKVLTVARLQIGRAGVP